jgi:hypothetical protein
MHFLFEQVQQKMLLWSDWTEFSEKNEKEKKGLLNIVPRQEAMALICRQIELASAQVGGGAG